MYHYIRYILKKVSNIDDDYNIRYRCISSIQITKDGTSIPFQQEDGHNCGPIACFVLWYLFNRELCYDTIKSFKDENLRHTLISELKRGVEKVADHLVSKTSYQRPTEFHNDDDHDKMEGPTEFHNDDDHDKKEGPTEFHYDDDHDKKEDDREMNDHLRDQIKKRNGNYMRRNAKKTNICLGDMVTVRVDKRDRYEGQENTGSIKVVTEYGILAKNTKSLFHQHTKTLAVKYCVLK